MAINPFPPPDILDALYGQHAPKPAPALPYRKMGDTIVCTVCDLAIAYCRGHASAVASPDDGAQSSLDRRAAEARERRH